MTANSSSGPTQARFELTKCMKWVATIAAVLSMSVSLASQTSPRANRITLELAAGPMVAVSGTVHLMTQRATDQGALNSDLQMESLTLNIGLSAAQQIDLNTLLEAQQDPKSPQYRQWLTQEQFGGRFGLTNADLSKVTGWLAGQGFTVKIVSKSRNAITFSGKAWQVESAFHTQLHQYRLDGETHFANATNLRVPAGLGDVILNVRGLDNFRLKPHVVKVNPQYTSGNLAHFLLPGDWASIYNVTFIYNAGYTGTSAHVGVMGQTYAPQADIDSFRSAAGLGGTNISYVCIDPTVANCTGPAAISTAGDLSEADLDIEWAGGIAKNATVDYVYAPYSDTQLSINPLGVFDALQYAVEHYVVPATGAVLPVLSMSYGDCEQNLNTTYAAWLTQVGKQATAQGQTIVVSSGDSGAAGCDQQGVAADVPTLYGASTGVPADSPYCTAVGGTTLFGDESNPYQYWNQAAGQVNSALSYIPERPWNETTPHGLAAGGGGVSTWYPMPTWQWPPGNFTGTAGRFVPDVAFTASANHDGYLVCSQDLNSTTFGTSCSSGFNSSLGYLGAAGGTSASAPSFAGMLTLLTQKYGPLGNVNPTLYKLAKNATTYAAVFHDITTGDNLVPCVTGSVGCVNGKLGYLATTGYDLVSGLGSIDGGGLYTALGAGAVASTPIVTWPTPGGIYYGMGLNSTQLNATADVPGLFTYTPSLGALLTPGAQTLSVLFTPTDSSTYSTITASVQLTVYKGWLSVTPASVTIPFGQPVPTLTGQLWGVVNNDEITASYSTTATAFSPVGTYPITVTLSDPNHRLQNYGALSTQNAGWLTIAPVPTASFRGGTTDFGTMDIGKSSPVLSIGIQFTADTSVGGVAVSTKGATGLDFQVDKVSNATACAAVVYSAGQNCTVNVVFSPLAPGARSGAVVLYDQATPPNALITVPVSGLGQGPTVTFGPGTITTAAGNGSSWGYAGDNGPATSAQLSYPTGLVMDGAGNLYIADLWNNILRKVTPGGTITTVAADPGQTTGAQFGSSRGLAVDGAGNLYVADSASSVIRKVTPSGMITTVAGNGISGYGGDGGPATSAQLWFAAGVAVDGAGNLFIADGNNHRIRKVTPGGTITTVAGNGFWGFSGDDGPATSAGIGFPSGVALDSVGNFYIADNSSNQIRKVTSGGTITTVAGNGTLGFSGDGGPATSAQLSSPNGVALDSVGNIYFADGYNHRIRRVTPGGTITTVAGSGATGPGNGGYTGDGGQPASALLNSPQSVTLDGAGNLYIADSKNNRIRKVNVSDAPSLKLAAPNVGSQSIAQDVTVLNLGNAPLTISQIRTPTNFNLEGADTSCSTGGQTLASAASCVLGIQFSPQAAGAFTGSLVLTDNALNLASATQSIAMQGLAGSKFLPIVTWTPQSISYGTQLNSTQLNATADVPGVFTYTPSVGTLPTPGAQTLSTLFTPSDSSTYSTVIASVPLTVYKGWLSVTPAGVTVPIGQPIPTLTGQFWGVVNNDGITASYSTTATATSPVGRYPITATLSDPKNRLQNYDVTLNTGWLTIASVPTASFQGGTTNFGTIDIGRNSPVLSIGIQFTAGTPVGSVAVSTKGATGLDFQVDKVANATACAAVVYSAGQNCTVNVVFSPRAPGVRSGAVVLYDTATPPNALITIPVSGLGQSPALAFGPGTITTVAGNGGIGYIGDNGRAINAHLQNPSGVAMDAAGNLYIADLWNNVVHKVTAGGTITTVAGNGSWGYSGDGGAATNAQLLPYGITVDGAGNLYIADSVFSVIRKVTPGGTITTVAGNGISGYGGDGGPATSARFGFPHGIVVDGAGNLYIADGNNHRIRKVTPGGTITTVAGNGSSGSSGDNGPATIAGIGSPAGIALDSAGSLYIAGSSSNRIRKVTSDGTITTVAGDGTMGFGGDGGLATSAQLSSPNGVALDSVGNVYIADGYNHRIRKVTPNGTITTVAGSGATGQGNGGYTGDGGQPISALLNMPNSLAVDGEGNLYITDTGNNRIRKVNVSDAPSLKLAAPNVGSPSIAQDVTVLNLGNAPLTISQIRTPTNFNLKGADTSCSTGGQTLASAASCVLGIQFSPQAAGAFTGSLVLTDNALNLASATQTIAMQGLAGSKFLPVITWLTPAPISYGMGVTSTQLNATTDVPGVFAYTPSPGTLPASGVSALSVLFTPSDIGTYSTATASVQLTVYSGSLWVTPGSVTIPFGQPIPTLTGQLWGVVSNDGITASYSTTATATSPVGRYRITATLSDPKYRLQNYDVALNTGWLTIASVPTASFQGGTTNFGTIDIGRNSPDLSIGIQFTAGTPVGSVAVSTKGAIGQDFQVDKVANATACAAVVYIAGQNCTVNVVFSPRAPGARSGAVVLYDTATPPNALITIPVLGLGRGPAVAFGPGTITTVAGGGSGGVNTGTAINVQLSPYGIAVDGEGNLYIADQWNNMIRKVTPGGTITRVAGNGSAGSSGDSGAGSNGDGGPAISAQLSYPTGVAMDGAGNLYIASNSVIRKVTPGGAISTVAGNGLWGYSGDGGSATNAQLSPNGIAVDGSGILYIADSSNHRIRKVMPGGTITTVAGNGNWGFSGDRGLATSAQLYNPMSVAVDDADNLYIADSGNNRIRKVMPDGTITTVAGNGNWGYSGDSGLATSAQLNNPMSIAVDSADNLYIADSGNNRIRKVTPDATITTIAGAGVQRYIGDHGPATSAQLSYPVAVAVDGTGNLYIADSGNNRVRKVNVSDAPALKLAAPNVGSPSIAQDVALLNLGNSPLTISQIRTSINFDLQGADTSCSTGGQTLAPAASCVLGIEFAPQFAGTISGSLVLTDNALNVTSATQTIALQSLAGSKFLPVITWPTPAPISYGMGVTSRQLNATADVPGLLTYTPSMGTILGPGVQTLSALFTPSDNSTYSTASASVQLTVNKSFLFVTPTSFNISFGQLIPPLTGQLMGVVNNDGITASYSTTAAATSPVGRYSITATLSDPKNRLQNYKVTMNTGWLTIASMPTASFLEGTTNFGTIDIGRNSPVSSIAIQFTARTTVGSVAIGTKGAMGLDFQADNAVNATACAAVVYSAGQTCTVEVVFGPLAPGARSGAVVLYDTATPQNALVTVPLSGLGRGPAVAFGPGTITTVAGSGDIGYSGDNGPATNAQLYYPSYAAVDSIGNLYIADSFNQRVRKVTPGGTITTIAGTGTKGYSGDNGPATSAQFYYPEGLALDGAGNLYIADSSNSVIRKVTPSGTITTVAGNGTFGYSGDMSLATNAQLNNPYGIALDGAGNLYIADTNNSVARKVTPGGTITTVAGIGIPGYSGDSGSATSAQLGYPTGVAVDGAGNLYISDVDNSVIRKVTPTGTITTVAGNGSQGYSGDDGPATRAELLGPWDVQVDGAGNLYIVDQENHRIRKVTPAGIITTVVGGGVAGFGNGGYLGDGGESTSALLNEPNSLALDSAGNMYISDVSNNRIRKVNVSDAPSLSFAATNVGSASATREVTVLNLGTAPLSISQISIESNFTMQGVDTSCVWGGQILAPADACVLSIAFAPQVAGNISGSMVLTDSALNAARAKQTITLRGNALGNTSMATTTTVSVTPNSLRMGGSITLSASVASTPAGTMTGAVTFKVGSATIGTAVVSNHTATLSNVTVSTANGFSAGSDSVTASYGGDANYETSIGSTTLSVTKALLTVVANNQNVALGAAIPVLTGTLTGVVAGDGITASYTTTALQGSTAGTYPIFVTLNDPSNKLSNYSVAITNGTLVVQDISSLLLMWLSPGSVTAGDSGFALTVRGTNFTPTSLVLWNGSMRATTFVSNTQLTAAISAADIAMEATYLITIANLAPNPGTSSALPLVVMSSTPVATIGGASLSVAADGSGNHRLTLTGTDFVSSSTVAWNGTSLATNYLCPGEISATISAANFTARPATLTVNNPAGTSAGFELH